MEVNDKLDETQKMIIGDVMGITLLLNVWSSSG